MIAAILGFIPAVDLRLSIATKSGTAANVVPIPAKNPMISDRRSLGAKRLAVSWGTRPSQPESQAKLRTRMLSITQVDRDIVTQPPSEISLRYREEYFCAIADC
jgi:hypothetical protein